MPTTAQPHIVTAEKIVMDPLQDSDQAYQDVTEYLAALPEGLDGHAGRLQGAFNHKVGLFATLGGPREIQERAYLRGQLIGMALQIGFYTGDLKRDWRN